MLSQTLANNNCFSLSQIFILAQNNGGYLHQILAHNNRASLSQIWHKQLHLSEPNFGPNNCSYLS